ncbi:TnsA-like heteromeric transposase endonuclease subunit [Nocardioides sp.]|uniref:TnsA-like heteromeric transposase endonuclease subunit n=1 Tax=Nocardioides sp. TaxID=35761 RepID=UPI00345C9C65
MGWGAPAATGTPLNDSRCTLESEGIALRDSSGDDWRWSAPRPTGTAWTFRTAGNAGVWSWDDGAPDPRLLLPVRRPRSGALSRHIPVRAFSMTTGAHIALESGLEHDLLRLLDRDGDASWLVPQPCRVEWPLDGRTKGHVPDLLTADRAGAVTVWDVKSPDRAHSPAFAAVAELSSDACREVGWAYRVFTGLTPVHRHNLLWLHGHRHNPAGNPHLEAEVLQECASGAVLGAVLGASSPERRAVVWHHVWTGKIRVDLSQPLTAATLVVA